MSHAGNCKQVSKSVWERFLDCLRMIATVLVGCTSEWDNLFIGSQVPRTLYSRILYTIPYKEKHTS